MRRESYVGTLRRDSSPATDSKTLTNDESKRTLKSLVGIFYLSAVGIGRKKARVSNLENFEFRLENFLLG